MYQLSLDAQDPIAWDDSDLEWLEQQRSLAEQYIGSYRRKDFNLALEGLQRFDARNKYGVFDDPEFQKIVEEISGYYPEDVDQPMIIHPGSAAEKAAVESKDPFEGASVEKKVEQTPVEEPVQETAPRRRQAPPAEETGDQLDTMDRGQLLGYIQMHKLDIQVTTDHSDAMIRDFIRTEEDLANTAGSEAPQEEAATEPMSIEETGETEQPAGRAGRRRGSSNIADSF